VRGLRPLLLLLLSLAVAACAGVLGWKKPRDDQRPFAHRRHASAGVNCLQCHERVVEAGEDGPLHLPTTSKCVSCHAQPHDARPCLDCHGNAGTRERAVAARVHLRFAHARHLPKLNGQCVPCHMAAGLPDDAERRPPMAQCFSCHAHQGQWAASDCNGCHVDLPSENVQPATHVVHAGDFLREHGVRAAASKDLCATCHAQSSCDGCHGTTVPALPWRLNTEKLGLARLHAGNFLSRHPDESRAQPGLCQSCHAENFCLSCHLDRKVAAKAGVPSPHPQGWVKAKGGEHGRAARMDPQACISCHGGAGEQLCVGCHKVGGPGGNVHGPGFQSTKDERRDEPCRLCHAP
jgi:hypothetical protein